MRGFKREMQEASSDMTREEEFVFALVDINTFTYYEVVLSGFHLVKFLDASGHHLHQILIVASKDFIRH